MESIDLVRRITRLIESNHSSTLFLNGPPGSGKSFFLNTLAKSLPSEVPFSFILGPYQVAGNAIPELCGRVLQQCFQAGYTTVEPPLDTQWDLVHTWKWLKENTQFAGKRNFIILVDIGNCFYENQTQISNLFSNVRYLEGVWDSSNVRIHHIFVGCWDHPTMETYFDGINTSFPYSVGHNYFVWHGISLDEMLELARERISENSLVPLSNILYELTAGHPGAAIDILSQMPDNQMSFSSLLSATRQAARKGQMSKEFVQFWFQLPSESKSLLKEMVLQRRIRTITFAPELERLLIAGIIHKKQIGDQGYADFRSWFVELIVQFHADELGITNEDIHRLDTDELMPRTAVICVEAYRLINEIENLARNYISVQLCLKSEPGFHYLMGRSRKYDNEKFVEEDAFKRAEDWKARSAARGLSIELNPLIAYLSTRDLANLIEESRGASRSPEWLRIAQSIRKLSDVRDAVMHNQLIDDDDLQHLYDLRSNIYEALSKQN